MEEEQLLILSNTFKGHFNDFTFFKLLLLYAGRGTTNKLLGGAQQVAI